MVRQIPLRDKYEKAISYINSAGDQLSLAWEIVEKASDFDSAEELFYYFRDDVIFAGGFKYVHLYQYTSNGFILYEPNPENHLRYDMLKKYRCIENFINKISVLYEVPKSNIIVKNIEYKDDIFGALVAITHKPPNSLTYSSLGIFGLFMQFIKLKIVERKERELIAFKKAISEKAMLISEHLILQNLWTNKLFHVLEILYDLLHKANSNIDYEIITKLVDELKSDVEPLNELNRSTRSVVKSFSYIEEMKAVPIKISLKSLFNGVWINIPPKFKKKLETEKYEVTVDPELFSEGINQIFFILNNLISDFERHLQIGDYKVTNSKIIIKIGGKKIKPCWLEFIKKGERCWNNNGEGPDVSGPVLLSYNLAKKLIRNSNGNLNILNEKEEPFLGFEIEIPRISKLEKSYE